MGHHARNTADAVRRIAANSPVKITRMRCRNGSDVFCKTYTKYKTTKGNMSVAKNK
jgi:hypothetical protein